MLRKLLITIALFVLTACNSQVLSGQSNMAYKVSDEEMNRFILIGNAMEQCLYPELKQANNEREKLDRIYNSWSPATTITMLRYAIVASFPSDIRYVLFGDKASVEYFYTTYNRLNHSKPTEPPYELTPQQCRQFKSDFSKTLKEIKEGKIKPIKDNQK